MARIPQAEIERLKREVSLERLAEARGIRLQRHGADLGLSQGKPPERSTAPKLPGLLDASAGDQALLRRVVDYYHASLKESPEALGVPRRSRPPARRGRGALPARLREPDPRLPLACEEPEGGSRDPGPTRGAGCDACLRP